MSSENVALGMRAVTSKRYSMIEVDSMMRQDGLLANVAEVAVSFSYARIIHFLYICRLLTGVVVHRVLRASCRMLGVPFAIVLTHFLSLFWMLCHVVRHVLAHPLTKCRVALSVMRSLPSMLLISFTVCLYVFNVSHVTRVALSAVMLLIGIPGSLSRSIVALLADRLIAVARCAVLWERFNGFVFLASVTNLVSSTNGKAELSNRSTGCRVFPFSDVATSNTLFM